MKKFILSLVVMFITVFTVNAQNETAAGTSCFTDNWSITLQGGVVTPFNNFFSGHTAMTPVVVIGTDKYVTPWLGFGLEGRTAIGTGTVGHAHNSYTAFDAVNVSGYGKLNLVNMFAFNSTCRMFEPVVYTGIGWGHNTAGVYDALGNHVGHNNYMTYRVGTEFNFNLSKERTWAVVVNPSVVWGDINNGKLMKSHGNFELTAGVVYHFKNKNGKRHFTTITPVEVTRVVEKTVTKEVVKEVPTTTTNPVAEVRNVLVEKTFVVPFAFNSAELTDEAKAVLDAVAKDVTVDIVAYASPEGAAGYNQALSQRRADAVADYLLTHGVNVASKVGKGVINKASNRIAIVTVQ